MTIDFAKFPFPGIENPHASSLTESIKAAPVDSGFVVVTLKGAGSLVDVKTLRSFACTLRASAGDTGLIDITAYRQLRPDEFGGAVPFDQAICDHILADVEKRRETQADRFPGLKMVTGILEHNAVADWVMLVEFRSPKQALATAERWRRARTVGQSASFASQTPSRSSTNRGPENAMPQNMDSGAMAKIMIPDIIQARTA